MRYAAGLLQTASGQDSVAHRSRARSHSDSRSRSVSGGGLPAAAPPPLPTTMAGSPSLQAADAARRVSPSWQAGAAFAAEFVRQEVKEEEEAEEETTEWE